MKLTRRHILALAHLVSRLGWVRQSWIPNGNGLTGASSTTMRELKTAGYVEYGKDSRQNYYGYRITPAGRLALKNQESDRG